MLFVICLGCFVFCSFFTKKKDTNAKRKNVKTICGHVRALVENGVYTAYTNVSILTRKSHRIEYVHKKGQLSIEPE